MSIYYGLDHPNPNLRQYNEKRRNPHGQVSGTIVVHTAENYGDADGPDSGAESVARFLSSRTTYGSYHDLCDSDSIVRYLPIAYEAFHETRTNHWAVGISAACRTTDWKTKPAGWVEAMYRMLAKSAADRVREIRAEYGIDVPIKHISRQDALNRKPGFIGHGEIDTARRSDPGKDFDWARFLSYVHQALTGGVVPNPAPAPQPSGLLVVDGFNGPASIERYQEIAGTPADGVISSPSLWTEWLQNWLNARKFRDYDGKALVVDGLGFYQNVPEGNDTPKTRTQYALQQYLETTQEGRRLRYVGDGMFSSPSVGVKIMQTEANAGRLFR